MAEREREKVSERERERMKERFSEREGCRKTDGGRKTKMKREQDGEE